MKNLQHFLMNAKEKRTKRCVEFGSVPANQFILHSQIWFIVTVQKGTCQRCPQICPHPVLMRSNKMIWFHAYEVVTTCTEHGVLLSAESKGHCQHCDSKREGEVLLGKLYKKRQLVVKRTKYNKFFNLYYLPALLKYCLHRFHMMILGK